MWRTFLSISLLVIIAVTSGYTPAYYYSVGVPQEVVDRQGKEAWVGDSRFAAETGATDFHKALAGIGTSTQTILRWSGNYNVGADTTVSSNITLCPENGGTLTIAAGVTLTINGPVLNGWSQIFLDNSADLAKGVKFGTNSTPFVRPEWWGTAGDGVVDDTSALKQCYSSSAPSVIVSRLHKVTDDITFPSTMHVQMVRGAQFIPGTIAGTGTIANADTAATGTITVTAGTSKVTGSGTNFWSIRPGQWITTNGGQRRQVRKIVSSLEMYVWQDWSASESGVSWTAGNYIVTGSGTAFTSQLRVGDFVYYGANSLVVTKVVNDTQLWAAEIPAATFSGQSFSRSVRAVIQGGFEAGMHQVFAGNGVCQFEGMVDFVRPEWWGAKASDSDADAAANSAAFEKAVYCQSFGGTAAGAPIQLSRGVYRLSRRVPLASNTYLRGQWLNYTYSRGSVIYPISAYNSPALLMDIYAHPGDASYNYTGPKIENLKIDTGERNFNSKPVNGIELTVSKYVHVTGNMFRNCYGNNLMLAGSASIGIIEGNYFDALGNAIWCPSYDHIITKNHIAFGNNVVTNGTFATDTGWTKGANWTIVDHVATHTIGSTETLSQEPTSWASLKYLREGESYSVWYSVSGCTTGSVTVSIGGHAGTARNADGTYVEFFTVTNGGNNTIVFTPTSDFNGSLDNVKIHYGVGVFLGGSPNMVTNNFLWGDRGSDACIAHYCADAIIANNDMVTSDYGIRFGTGSGKLLTNNQFRGNRAYGLFFPNGSTSAQQIRQNYFETGLGITPLAAIHCPAAATFSGAVVTDNYFQTASFPAYLELGASSSSHPLFKDNVGLDDQGLITIAGATPSVVTGNRFITANTGGATTITDLTRGAVGKEVTIITGDANTTINNGGNFSLSANFAAPPVGSSITLIKSSSGLWVEKGRSITP